MHGSIHNSVVCLGPDGSGVEIGRGPGPRTFVAGYWGYGRRLW